MSVAVPFTLAIPQSALDDLQRRLHAVRWPDAETVDDWSQGVPLSEAQALVRYWRDDYDWRRCERMLNAAGQCRIDVDGLGIHLLHVRSPYADAMPLLLTHGWPGSIVEFLKAIPALIDPVAHGGHAEDAFHVVVPSLPGYGLSDKPDTTGWTIHRIARAWADLMRALGYTRYIAQGGDWGSYVTMALGHLAPAELAGIHINAVPLHLDPAGPVNDGERAAVKQWERYQAEDAGYSTQQSTRPQTLGYALADSPVGQAMWILEKFQRWTDCDGDPRNALGIDEMLDTIMLYWLGNNGASSARLYWESFGKPMPHPIAVPVGATSFPHEIIRPPRSTAERAFPTLTYWNEVERGGHFAAFEQPAIFVEELRRCFRLMR